MATARRQRRLFWWLSILLIIAISLTRVINLGTKPYWYDEVYTSLRLSGYTKADVLEFSQSGQHTFGELKQFQCPNANNTVNDTLNSLITDSTHPPFYFALLYYWAKLTGCNVTNLRLLSSLLSLLVILVSYLLAYEIFRQVEVALLATVLMAASPIFLIYAQEARAYALMTFLSLLSSWIFLRIQRDRKNLGLYCGYIVITTVGLYCHTLYQFVVFAQVMYCLSDIAPDSKSAQKDPWIQKISVGLHKHRAILLSVLLSWGLFIVWLIRVVRTNGFTIRAGANYTWKDFPLSLLWQRITLNLTGLIYDFQHPFKSKLFSGRSVDDSVLSLGPGNLVIVVLVCALLLYSTFYTLYLKRTARSRLLSWLAILSGIFLLKDLVLGGSASTIIRYQLLTVVVIYFALAFYLVDVCRSFSGKLSKGIVVGVVVFLLQLQLYSNWVYLASPSWWSKLGERRIDDFAELVHQSCNPLILVESSPGKMIDLLKFNHALAPSVPYQLVAEEDISTESLRDSDAILETNASSPAPVPECREYESKTIGFSEDWARAADLNYFTIKE